MAYAAAVSLLRILKELQESAQFSRAQYPKSQIHHLHGKICSLKDFLEKNSSLEDNSESTIILERQIRDAIYEAEDVIESHMSHQFLASGSGSTGEENNMSTFCEGLQRAIQDIDSVAEEIEQLTAPRGGDLIVGRYNDIVQLVDRLRGSSSAREVVSIFGIRGIGKTSLARAVYNDPLIKSDFEIRAWIKVSREYHKRDILLGLLRSMEALGGGPRQETDDQLARYLHYSLRSKKYLVVLDDVCDVEAWNDLKELLPDYNDGSRVILTTRFMDVAKFANNKEDPHEVCLLSDEDSWVLLCLMVFPYKLCPELEQIAKNIASKCRGLPLAIVIIGRVLAKAGIRGWQTAASSISDSGNHEELVEIVLSLNYRSLPQHMKACLLYMGIFPHNYGIPVSKLIKLWIAEGFLELNSFQTLKEMAQEIILQLVNRSLISVCEQSSSSRAKACMIDDVYWDFIRTKAEEEKFFHVINKHTKQVLEDSHALRRLCMLENICLSIKDMENYNSKAWVSTARSLLYCGPVHQHPLSTWLNFKLLRVLDALDIRFYSFPPEILKLVQLRYLAFTYNRELPDDICKLRNLQVLIVLRNLSTKYFGRSFRLPVDIWNMKELRHLQVMGRDLLATSTFAGGSPILGSLLILLDVSSHSCTPDILHRIPNLKKLGVRIESPALDAPENFIFLNHLHILHRLESLKCVVMHPGFSSQVVPSIPAAFPPSLRKLCLSGCGFSWKSMKLIAALPNLEVLKLQNYSFRGFKWKLSKVEFVRLKFLQLEDMDVVKWISSRANFPSLGRLIVRHCYKLLKIPYGFGEIETLEMIEVDGCNRSVVKSVLSILEMQREIGNFDFQVRVPFFME